MHVHQDLREKHILGSGTSLIAVRADESDRRPFLKHSPVCPLLHQYHITHCGIMNARRPFEIVRTSLSGTYFFACLSGKGMVLVDGDWTEVGPGQACLQPPFIPNALTARYREPWRFCWVRYQESPEIQPIVSMHSPVLGQYNAAPLRAAIEGLHAEASGGAAPAALHHWTELIHTYVLSFAQPFQEDDRLRRVWEAVADDLKSTWTLERLAKLAYLSKEHLRRLTFHSLGRTPMQHVSFLRMRQAVELLTTTDDKIEAVANEVGYTNPFAFSDAFKRWIGRRPSSFRRRL